MKIGILTQKMWINYGGMLQNWALQQVLKDMGHEPATIIYNAMRPSEWMKQALRCLAHKTLRTAKRHTMHMPHYDKRLYRSMREFSNNVTCYDQGVYLDRYAPERDPFDAYIVGSDQVWRPQYNNKFGAFRGMFCGFLTPEFNKPHIAYAASFGTDEWEYTPAQEAVARELVRNFNAVSIREASGVTLCRDHLGIEAVQVLDPTLLLPAECYRRLSKTCGPGKPTGRCGIYVLDLTVKKLRRIEDICGRLGLKPFHFGRPEPAGMSLHPTYPPLEEWLAAYDHCDYIVTDSFHGAAFAVIYQRPFSVMVNAERGASRFVSLLSDFGLEARMETNADPAAPINWDHVESNLRERQKASMTFLTQNLRS